GVGLGEFAKEAPGPIHIAIARTRPDERGRHSVGGHPGGVALELRAVIFGVEVAAAAPGLVADAPIAHAQAFGFAIGRALRSQGGGIRRGVAVLHPAPEFLCREAAHVGGKVRLGAHLFAKPGELHGSESVRIIALRTVAARAFGHSPASIQKLVRLGRLSRGPVPSRQSYWSAKQPPGQRIMPGLTRLRASTNCLRSPPTLGMREFSPTQMPSYTTPPRFSTKCP